LIARYSPALARNSRVYFYRTLDASAPALPPKEVFQKNAVFHPYSLLNYVEDQDMCVRGKAFVYDGLKRGLIRRRIDRVYPMERYVEAFEYPSQPRRRCGKVGVATGR
jgi:hypothetical protein